MAGAPTRAQPQPCEPQPCEPQPCEPQPCEPQPCEPQLSHLPRAPSCSTACAQLRGHPRPHACGARVAMSRALAPPRVPGTRTLPWAGAPTSPAPRSCAIRPALPHHEPQMSHRPHVLEDPASWSICRDNPLQMLQWGHGAHPPGAEVTGEVVGCSRPRSQAVTGGPSPPAATPTSAVEVSSLNWSKSAIALSLLQLSRGPSAREAHEAGGDVGGTLVTGVARLVRVSRVFLAHDGLRGDGGVGQ